MNMMKFFDQVSAARRLSIAFERGAVPNKEDLATLGMPTEIKRSFKR
ncbi:MAG: hypothetical protein AAFY99_14070 [Pseudomonadota bacterium]